MKNLNIGLCGLGTVGKGVVDLLKKNASAITAGTGVALNLSAIGVRRKNPAYQTGDIPLIMDIFTLTERPDIDVIVELIGGTTTAKTLIIQAMQRGKHVVTANKALIAEHGNELFALAAKQGVMLAYEAAVAGGIPIIKLLKEGLIANNLHTISGIINGTCNFILTEMLRQQGSFATILQQAQDKGYAEADPSFDIDGIDAAHKIAICASLAFGMPLAYDKVYREGIRHIDLADIHYASELGYKIKHLAIARRTDKHLSLSVYPALIKQDHPLANIERERNALFIQGEPIGDLLVTGAGAGSGPTASAVVADLVDFARHQGVYRQEDYLVEHGKENLHIVDMMQDHHAFYLRMEAKNEAGVLAKITRVLAQKQINIESIVQKEHHQGNAHIVVITNPVGEQKFRACLNLIQEAAYMISVKAVRVHVA